MKKKTKVISLSQYKKDKKKRANLVTVEVALRSRAEVEKEFRENVINDLMKHHVVKSE